MNLNIFKNTNLSIGLLGGSFNPPHEGHVFISNQIIQKFGLDFVWWLVTPCNPLKSLSSISSFEQRMKDCQVITKSHHRIIVTDIEKRINSNRTFNSVSYIIKHFHRNHFIYILGADNLVRFHHWYRWQDIWLNIKIAIYNRNNYQYKSSHSKVATRFDGYKISRYSKFKEKDTPCWCVINDKLINISSTQIRQKLIL